MDSIRVSEALDSGSIPDETTIFNCDLYLEVAVLLFEGFLSRNHSGFIP